MSLCNSPKASLQNFSIANPAWNSLVAFPGLFEKEKNGLEEQLKGVKVKIGQIS